MYTYVAPNLVLLILLKNNAPVKQNISFTSGLVTPEKMKDKREDRDLSSMIRLTDFEKDGTENEGLTLNVDSIIQLANEEAEEIRQQCPFYKGITDFNIYKMIGSWQLVFYKLAKTVTCFTIHIQKMTDEKRMYNRHVHGDYNGTIHWDNCLLEINSSGTQVRKHFLMQDGKSHGILKNVIFMEHFDKGRKSMVLVPETPNQWLTIGNLLLMRDCENGEVVVFLRRNQHVSQNSIKDAMKIFGEDMQGGRFACTEDYEVEGNMIGENVMERDGHD